MYLQNKFLTTLLLTLFVLLSISYSWVSPQTGTWTLQNPQLTGLGLSDVVFPTHKSGWIVGARGTILNSTDSGTTWQLQTSPKNNNLLSVHFFDEKEGWAAGGVYGRSLILHTTDGGQHWQEVATNMPEGRYCKVYFQNRKKGWILGPGRIPNYIFTNDSGKTWNRGQVIGKPHPSGQTAPLLSDICFVDDSIGFLAGDLRYIAKTTDGGTTWAQCSVLVMDGQESPIFNKLALFRDSKTNGVIGGGVISLTGAMYIPVQNDTLWVPRITSSVVWTTLYFPDITTTLMLGGGYPVRVERTSPALNGQWQYFALPINPAIYGLHMFSPQEGGIAVGNNGTIHRIFGLADSTREITKGTGEVSFIDFCDSLTGSCAAENGVLITTDGGRNWKSRPGPRKGAYVSTAYLFDKNNLCISYKDSTAFSPDLGQTWQWTSGYGFYSFSSLMSCKLKDGHTAYGMSNAGLVRTEDAGKSWHVINSNFYAATFFFLTHDTGWAAIPLDMATHSRGTLAFTKTTDGGKSWDTLQIIENFFACSMHFINNNRGMITGEYGTNPQTTLPIILRTENGGQTWIVHNSIERMPNYARPTDGGSKPTDAMEGKSRGIWTSDWKNMWLLDNHRVFFSNDTGLSWYEQPLPQQTFEFFSMCAINDNNIWVTGDGGSIWKFSSKNTTNSSKPITDRTDNFYATPRVTYQKKHLIWNSTTAGPVTLLFFNASGTLVFSIPTKQEIGLNSFSLISKKIGLGAYICQIREPNGMQSNTRIIICR